MRRFETFFAGGKKKGLQRRPAWMMWGIVAGLVLVVAILFIRLNLALISPGPSPNSGSGAVLAEPPATETQESPETPPPEATLPAIDNLQEVHKAIIQIESQGEFAESPSGSSTQPAGTGLGFIIDSSGMAVTDLRSVVGATAIKVWVGGDRNQSYNARLLGFSECMDLAVIQLDGGPFYPLALNDATLGSGATSFIAGFTGDEQRFSLTKADLTNPNASAAIRWAAPPSLIEFNAYSAPDVTGSPVVDSNGRVVAMQVASQQDKQKVYALPEAEITAFLQNMQPDNLSVSVGINGIEVPAVNPAPPGIWVSSVQPNSAAMQVGLKSGDIITKIGDQTLDQADGFNRYCQVLSNYQPGTPVAIEVYRDHEQQFLAGEFNRVMLTSVRALPTSTPSLEEELAGLKVNLNANNPGDIIYSTEFEKLDYWYSFSVPSGGMYDTLIRNKNLYIQDNEKNTSVYTLFQIDLPADVRLDATVRTVAGPNRNNINLICRATSEGWYEFSMNSGGYWFIWRYENGNYEKLNTGGSHAINMQKAQNEISAVCKGNQLSFYVNGTLMGTASDKKFTEGGQVGVGVSTFDISGAGVEFEGLAASVP